MRIYILCIYFLLVHAYQLEGQDLGFSAIDHESIDLILTEAESSISELNKNLLAELEYAYRSSDSLNYSQGIKRSSRLLYKYYKSLGNYEKASDYHYVYLDLKDIMFLENQENVEAEFQKQYDPETKTAEIDLLRSRNEIELLNYSRKRLVLISTWVGLGLVIIVVGLIYMRYRLKQRSKSLLEEQNKSFNRTNEQLKGLNLDLEKSEQDLRSLNQTKDRFFLLISEELRSPLSSLSSQLGQLIKEGRNYSKEDVNNFAININEAVNSLLELIENLLQWSRTQMDSVDYSEEIINISALIEENMQLLKPQADSKSLVISYDSMDCHVSGDKNMIHFVVRNLILNAIKFSSSSSELKIISDSKGEKIALSIEMNGKEEVVSKIIKLWKSETPIGESLIKDEKTSLGLLLTKYFVEKNSGHIGIEQIGERTKFELSLKAG